MKAFKDKAYTPPVDKIRKDLGRFSEKIDKKAILSRYRAANNEKNVISTPTFNKKRLNCGQYFLLVFIFGLIFFFFVMVVTVLLTKKPELEL